jgi:hypothetical protein
MAPLSAHSAPFLPAGEYIPHFTEEDFGPLLLRTFGKKRCVQLRPSEALEALVARRHTLDRHGPDAAEP